MLKLNIKTAQTQPIASFELEKNQSLSQRVKIELDKAKNNGDINGLNGSSIIPSVAVFEEGDDKNPIETSSIALFDLNGKELTFRDYKLKVEDKTGNNALISLYGTDEGKKDVLIGIFFTEENARMIGSMWKAGVL